MSLTISHSKPSRTPLQVIIKVYDLATGDEIRSHTLNYNDPGRRIWLQKLCVWAWSNGHSVETYNVVNKELAEKDA